MTVRPISIRLISDVPSKIVKILAVRTVSTGQQPAGPLVSARIQHAPSEMNVGFGLARSQGCGHSRYMRFSAASVLTGLRAVQRRPVAVEVNPVRRSTAMAVFRKDAVT